MWVRITTSGCDLKKAVDRVRDSVNEALDTAERTSSSARREANQAFDTIEKRIDEAQEQAGADVDAAFERLWSAVNTAFEQAKELNVDAREEAHEAIDELEELIEKLR